MVESREVNTVEIGETSASPAKSLCSLDDAPVRTECLGAELGHEDRNLTMAGKDCVLTSSDDDVEDLIAFVDHVHIIISSNVCCFHWLLPDN